jgi:hypothetical protein
MQFLSQYSSVALQLFDGHPLGKDSRWIVIQPTGTTRRATFYAQSRCFLVDPDMGQDTERYVAKARSDQNKPFVISRM